jgi:hypothetical protein
MGFQWSIPALMAAQGAYTPIELVDSVSAGSTDGNDVTTSAIDTSGANFLVLVLANYSASANTVISDSKGNTWSTLTAYDEAPNAKVQIYYVESPIVGAGHTFSGTGTTDFPAIAVAAFKNVKATGSFDQENGDASSGNFSSKQTGSVTPSFNNELLIAGNSTNFTDTVSINSGFTLVENVTFTVSEHLGCAMAYKIQTALNAENPEFTYSGSSDSATCIATFAKN